MGVVLWILAAFVAFGVARHVILHAMLDRETKRTLGVLKPAVMGLSILLFLLVILSAQCAGTRSH